MTLRASTPTFWEVSTESEFLRGEIENLSIDSFGRLTLGPTASAGLRDQRAVRLDDGERAGWFGVRRQWQRGSGLQDRLVG